MIGGVAGRRHRLHGPAVAADRIAILERGVGTKVHVGRGVEPARVADVQRARQPVRPFGKNRGAGRGLDLRHGGRMVAMGVRDENVGHGLAAHRIEQRSHMGVVVRAGIDDRDFAAPEDVAHRALESERPRVVGDDCPHIRRHLFGGVGHKIERLIEWDVVAHCGCHALCREHSVIMARESVQPRDSVRRR